MDEVREHANKPGSNRRQINVNWLNDVRVNLIDHCAVMQLTVQARIARHRT